MSKVYFSEIIDPQAIWEIFCKLPEMSTGNTGIKLHFGEAGNKNYLSPHLVEYLAGQLKADLVETNVLYLGPRRETESHLRLAKEHGFNFAEIRILDDCGEIAIPYKGMKHFDEVRLPKGIDDYNRYVVYSHFKGHILSGFGGAIKNVGMGMASIPGKMAQHSSTIPRMDRKFCISCGLCVEECPGKAITLDPLKIDPELCVGCGKCIGVCPRHVYSVNWGSTGTSIFQERLAEYAYMISNGREIVFINVLANISRLCDCDKGAPPPFIEDIGILASTDMVAIDKASYDLVNKRANSDDIFLEQSGVSGFQQLEYAAQIGLGSLEYELIRV